MLESVVNLRVMHPKVGEEPSNSNRVAEDHHDDSEESKGGKLEASKIHNANEVDGEITELLGSVTTHHCPGTRFSARVIQKMKQDQIRPATPPNEREQKKDEKSLPKTPSNMRAKPIWTNLERNHFFDAINEFGKDFEAIGNYINMKLKRKNATDKTTHQVRQHYYQTYHKICKYIKFSDEVKKPVQELYALINYGEMRRKLQFVTDKHFMKLKKLVYQGHITVRCKGKNIRVKTPSCKALRRINQLDDTLEDIRLPSKIEVLLTPANMETFGRIQTIAQNPKVRCMVPLHRKLVYFIKMFQYKWRSPESRLAEEQAKLFSIRNDSTAAATETSLVPQLDTEMCFLPRSGVPIHRPLLSITEHLSSSNICLSAYEERLGVKVRGETLCQDHRFNAKRQRTDSGSEKRSPETKKLKPTTTLTEKPPTTLDSIVDTHETQAKENPPLILVKSECSSSDELNDDVITELLSDNDIHPSNRMEDITTIATLTTSNELTTHAAIAQQQPGQQQIRAKRGSIGKSIRTNMLAPVFKPLLNDETMRRIRQGWTVSTAGDLTIGDLYVVLGHDARLELEYYWTDMILSASSVSNAIAATSNGGIVSTGTRTSTVTSSSSIATGGSKIPNVETPSSSIFYQKISGMPYNPTDCDPELLNTISTSSIGTKLKHLLLIANLSERTRKRQCSCGHICERSAAKTRIERDVAKTMYSGKLTLLGPRSNDNKTLQLPTTSRNAESSVFRQPNLPPRRPLNYMDPVKQLAALSGQKTSRQVFVQRSLLPSGAHQSTEIDSTRVVQTELTDNNNQSTTSNQPETTSQIQANSEDFTRAENFQRWGDNAVQSSQNQSQSQGQSVCSFAGTVEALSIRSASPQQTFETTPALTSASEQQSTPPSSTDSAIDDCSSVTSLFGGVSPMQLIRETTSNSRWLEDNLNDFSLTSLLGHLDEITANRDIVEPSNISVISESSVDYMHKFQEISALMQKQDKD